MLTGEPARAQERQCVQSIYYSLHCKLINSNPRIEVYVSRGLLVFMPTLAIRVSLIQVAVNEAMVLHAVFY